MEPKKIKRTDFFPETYYPTPKPVKTSRKKTEQKLALATEKLKKSYARSPEGKIFLSDGTPIDKKFYDTASGIIIDEKYKTSTEERERIIKLILPLGTELLKYLAGKGLKITVVNSKKLPKDWPEKEIINGEVHITTAYYLYTTKIIHLRNDYLTRSTILHEMAHPLDDFISDDKKNIYMADIKNTKLQKLYDEYVKRCKKIEDEFYKWKKNGKIGPEPDNSIKWSDYARRTDAGEYFAEAFRYYFTSHETRKILQDADPDMYDYIANREYYQNIESQKID